ncbi:MAG: RHS repeat protein [Lachnospiraceae bacterium]|nr:RHS repeat protein [Lachnospiraceae bacterium]
MNKNGKLVCSSLCNLIVAIILVFMSFNRVVASGIDSSSKVNYQYDELGRIRSATYIDGSVFEYNYDDNGNIISIIIKRNDDKTDGDKEKLDKDTTSTEEKNQDKTTEKVTEKTTEETPVTTTENVMETATEETSRTTTERITEKSSEGTADNRSEQASGQIINGAEEKVIEVDDKHTISDGVEHSVELKLEKEAGVDIDNISQLNFKKKRPVIKSFKLIKKKGKRYLRIQLRKLVTKGEYQEIGYQIRYSDNSKFKKSKTLFVKRNSKKNITTKKWKTKKSKSYYVKVRAYIITKSRKKIYSRYSRVRKIILQ